MTKHPYCQNPECHIELTMEKHKRSSFQIDHIKPYSQTQDNSESNLQLLCTNCHYDKTREEKNDNEHVAISKTHSSFNKTTGDIFSSKLSQSLAFVETVAVNESGDDEHCLDINKCRRNILYYNQYNYPQFTVMDSVQEYQGQISPGKYYIETNSYQPLRGNGW